jgi:hypothetical protein
VTDFGPKIARKGWVKETRNHYEKEKADGDTLRGNFEPGREKQG